MDFEARYIAALRLLRNGHDLDSRDAPAPADEDAFRDLRTWKLAKDDGVGILHRLTASGATAVQPKLDVGRQSMALKVRLWRNPDVRMGARVAEHC